MLNEIPKSDDPIASNHVTRVGPGADGKEAPRPPRDTLPDVGADVDLGLVVPGTDVGPGKVGQKKSPADNTAKKILSPAILLSEGYGPTPNTVPAESPEQPMIDVVEGGIPKDVGAWESETCGLGGEGVRQDAKRSLSDRAKAARTQFEAAVRENPVRAVSLAAGAGFVAGTALFATPVVRVLVGGIATVALQSDGAKRIYGHVGTGLVDKLEGLFTGELKA